MFNKPSTTISNRQARGDDDSIDFKYIFRHYAGHWKLFLICLATGLAIACVYYKISKPVYDIKATILMQDDGKDKSTEEKSALQELDLVNPPKIIENEVQVFKSRSLIKLVVDELQLWVSYTSKNGLNTEDLYARTPIKFNLCKPKGVISNQVLRVKILDRDSYQLLDSSNKRTDHRFRDTIHDSWGSWAITSTEHISAYTGKTINIILTDPETAVTDYQNAVDASIPDKLSSIIDLTISDSNARRGEDFLNNLIYFYKQSELAEKNNITQNTLDFIDKRLDSLVGELNTAESKVEGFRSSKGLTDINAQSQVYLQNEQSNDSKLNDVNIQLSVIAELEHYVNSGNNEGSVPSTLGISDSRLVELVQKLSELQLERTKLLATLPEKNPAFEPINKQIALTKLNVNESLRNIKSSLLTTRHELQSFRSNTQSAISNIPGQERQLTGLQRKQSLKENLYTYLLQKREQISLSYASSLSSARLLDVAYILPLKKSRMYIPFAVAFLFGIFAPVGFIYSRDLIKDTVNKRKQIEVATALPVLAEFSYAKLHTEIITDHQNRDLNYPLIEQFRHLRTQLSIQSRNIRGGMVALVTSSITQEGKSFISNNLAVSLAKSGKKTILLEMDIYKPKVSDTFRLEKALGISDYLATGINKSLIIQKAPFQPNLHLIGSGTFLETFAELLDQPELHRLIRELRSEYDYILIDTPPLHSINDANILAQFSDMTLFIVRQGYTPKSMLAFIRNVRLREELPQMGIIFNGLEDGRDGEGYRYEKYDPAIKTQSKLN